MTSGDLDLWDMVTKINLYDPGRVLDICTKNDIHWIRLVCKLQIFTISSNISDTYLKYAAPRPKTSITSKLYTSMSCIESYAQDFYSWKKIMRYNSFLIQGATYVPNSYAIGEKSWLPMTFNLLVRAQYGDEQQSTQSYIHTYIYNR